MDTAAETKQINTASAAPYAATATVTSSQQPHSFAFVISQENSLLDAASRLFASLTQLKRNLQYYNLQQLRDYLLNELQLFQTRTEALGYDRETIMIAHYALSATLDEIIDKTPLSSKLNWSKNSLLKTFRPELNIGDHFFVILEKLCQKPVNFIDLIELMFICLSLGFEGRFRNHPLEKARLQDIIDHTYQLIRTIRGEFDRRLAPLLTQPNKQLKSKLKSEIRRVIPLWSIVLVGMIMISGMYYGFNSLLKICSNQAIHQLQTLSQETLS